MSDRAKASEYLLGAVGHWVSNDEGKTVERVGMCGGDFLCFDENGDVDGFKSLSEALDYLGL